MTPTVTFERNKAVPPRNDVTYPFERLKPGDSFVVHCAVEEQPRLIARVRAALNYWLRTRPQLRKKFRVLSDPAGVRVGRIG